MKTHKIAYKHGEKLLVSGIAAAALGLINGKTKTVKASAIPNNGSALKKASKTRLKTKINYQTARSKLVKRTEALEASNEPDAAEAATDKPNQAQAMETDTTTPDPADDQVSENNQTGSATGNKTQTTEKSDKTDIPEKFDPAQATKTIRHGTFNSIPFTFDTDAGTFTLISEDGKVADFGKFTPVFSGSNIYDGDWYTPLKDVRNIIFSGKFKANYSIKGMFSNLPKLVSITGLDNIDFDNVANMQDMFKGDTALKTIEGLDNLRNASSVHDMSGMFQECSAITSLDLSSINFNMATSFQSMFANCSSLNNLILPDNIDTFNVTNMASMFEGCSSLYTITFGKASTASQLSGTPINNEKSLNLTRFDTSNVTDMSNMFKGCTSLNGLDISSFNMSKLTDEGISDMLNDLPSLNILVLGKNCKTKIDKYNANLDTTGTWVNVGKGKLDKPEASKKWSSRDLITSYDSKKDADTYIRYSGGLVTVHYQDQDGNPVLDDSDKPIPDDYLVGNVGQSIPVDTDKKIPGYQIAKDQDFGTFTSEPKDVYVIYNADFGYVNVHYEDENGKPLLDKDGKKIEDSSIKTMNGHTWSINPQNKEFQFDGYKLVKIDGKTSGVFDKDNPPTITLVYTDQGKVIIHYQDENGKPLLDKNGKEIKDSFLQGKIDQDKWNINPNDYKLPGYAFVKADGKTSGIFDATNPTVTLVYTDQGKVTIYYRDENGKPLLDKNGKEIDHTILHGKIGQARWNINPNDYKFPGYAFVSADGKTSGIFDASEPIVTLQYTSKAQPIKVHYVDNQGKSISEDRIISGTIGQKIPVEPKEIPGYSVSEINGQKITDKGNITLYLSDKLQEITYTYTQNSSSTPNKAKAPNVTVHYQDEYGNILAPNVVLEGYVGDGYTSETKSISGYTLKTRPNNATGFFTTFPQDVTYIYSKNGTNNNQITDKQPDNNKPTKVPTIKKPKRKPTRHLRNINRRKQLDKKSSIPTKLVQRKTITQQANSTNNKYSSSLPQTGKNQHSSLAMLTLGGIALISAFSLAWLDRKKE